MADVFFIDARARASRGVAQKFASLVDRLGLDWVKPGDHVAVKVHFGDEGTTRFVRPLFSRIVVDNIRKRGGLPFLTDTLTLYRGARSAAPSHLELAITNGFGFSQVNAPLIIADGLRSRDFREVPIGLKHFKTVRIGAAACDADGLVCLSHFKGHLASGFGGTIKNLAMGLGTRSQKQQMHASVRPRFDDADRCIGCGDCVDICPTGAVEVSQGKAHFDHQICNGCAECIVACPEGALAILWNESSAALQEKMVETALGAVANTSGRTAYFNFLLDITPDCDCFPWSDTPIVPDIGVLASDDPVALEQASVDLVNAQPGLPNSRITTALAPGEDKFRALYASVDWERQLEYGQEVGLGQRDYQLVTVE